jgi:hypothetical protein
MKCVIPNRWDDQCIQQGDRPFGKGVTGKFIGRARTDLQHCEAFGNFCFLKYLFRSLGRLYNTMIPGMSMNAPLII